MQELAVFRDQEVTRNANVFILANVRLTRGRLLLIWLLLTC